jgi:hypothetical protein
MFPDEIDYECAYLEGQQGHLDGGMMMDYAADLQGGLQPREMTNNGIDANDTKHQLALMMMMNDRGWTTQTGGGYHHGGTAYPHAQTASGRRSSMNNCASVKKVRDVCCLIPDPRSAEQGNDKDGVY